MGQNGTPNEVWPSLPFEAWRDTCATLHMWTQIVGKIRMAQGPWLNHSWHVTLYVTPTGLTTSSMPHGTRTFVIDFDFIRHQLIIQASDGAHAVLPLEAQSVATFYRRLMETLEGMGLHVDIRTMPNEVPDPIPFDRDETHRTYDPDHANRYWRVLLQVDRVFREFRSRFIGKCSPVHYFWGGPDLAITRFSGRYAPEHPGGIPNMPDSVTREAYSQEVSSCGFWPGGDSFPHPMFYSYAYPEPAGYSEAVIRPSITSYNADLREFILLYEDVRRSESPDATLLDFLQTTYDAAADRGNWDRGALERATL